MDYIKRHGAQLVTASGVGIWGLLLLNPATDSFQTFSVSLSEMAKHGTENQWGALAFIIASIIFLGLRFEYRPFMVIGISLAIAFRTFTLVLVGIKTSWTSTGIGDFALWTLIALYALYQTYAD